MVHAEQLSRYLKTCFSNFNGVEKEKYCKTYC